MKTDPTDTIFGGAFLGLLAAILFILAFVTIPDKNMTLFTSLASGVIGSGVGTFIGFRWGSSKSSQAKDATIAQMKNPDPTPPPPAAQPGA